MILDVYVVNCLFQNTDSGKIIWHRSENGGNGIFLASLNEGTENQIDLRTYILQGLASAPQICLELLSLKLKKSGKFNKTVIIEPLSRPLRRSYETQDEQNLAETLKKLYSVIVNKSTNRELSGIKDKDRIRQEIYRQLLNFENPD